MYMVLFMTNQFMLHIPGTLIYYGVDPSIPPSYLPVGLAERDYQVDIHIKVTDSYGVSVSTNVTAKVSPHHKRRHH